MNRYFEIRNLALKCLEEKAHGFYKRQMLEHMFQTETLCILLAQKRQLNLELSAIIGVLHDLTIPLDCNDFNHAARSSMIAKDILMQSGLFTKEEISLITSAIANHSHKERVDDAYSELIKDADVLSHVLQGEILKEQAQKRYQSIHL